MFTCSRLLQRMRRAWTPAPSAGWRAGSNASNRQGSPDAYLRAAWMRPAPSTATPRCGKHTSWASKHSQKPAYRTAGISEQAGPHTPRLSACKQKYRAIQKRTFSVCGSVCSACRMKIRKDRMILQSHIGKGNCIKKPFQAFLTVIRPGEPNPNCLQFAGDIAGIYFRFSIGIQSSL